MLPLLELNVAKLSVHQTSISMDADRVEELSLSPREELRNKILPLLKTLVPSHGETMGQQEVLAVMQRIVDTGKAEGLSAAVDELLTGFLNKLMKKKPSLASDYDFIVSISKMEPKLLFEVDWDPLVKYNPVVIMNAAQASQPQFWSSFVILLDRDNYYYNTYPNLFYESLEFDLQDPNAIKIRNVLTIENVTSLLDTAMSAPGHNPFDLSIAPQDVACFWQLMSKTTRFDHVVIQKLIATSWVFYTYSARYIQSFFEDENIIDGNSFNLAMTRNTRVQSTHAYLLQTFLSMSNVLQMFELGIRSKSEEAEVKFASYMSELTDELFRMLPNSMFQSTDFLNGVAAIDPEVFIDLLKLPPFEEDAALAFPSMWPVDNYVDQESGLLRRSSMTLTFSPFMIFMLFVADALSQGQPKSPFKRHLADLRGARDITSAQMENEVERAVNHEASVKLAMETASDVFMTRALKHVNSRLGPCAKVGSGFLLNYASPGLQESMELRTIAAFSWSPAAIQVLTDMKMDLDLLNEEYWKRVLEKAAEFPAGVKLFGPAMATSRVDMLRQYSKAASKLSEMWTQNPPSDYQLTDWDKEQRREIQARVEEILIITEDPQGPLFKNYYKREFEDDNEPESLKRVRARINAYTGNTGNIGNIPRMRPHTHWTI